jgi:hypothetical protein
MIQAIRPRPAIFGRILPLLRNRKRNRADLHPEFRGLQITRRTLAAQLGVNGNILPSRHSQDRP